jgi:hypothetical protein
MPPSKKQNLQRMYFLKKISALLELVLWFLSLFVELFVYRSNTRTKDSMNFDGMSLDIYMTVAKKYCRNNKVLILPNLTLTTPRISINSLAAEMTCAI